MEKQRIIEYLVDNKEYLKTLIQDLSEQKDILLQTQHAIFYKEIMIQYKNTIKEIVSIEIAKSLGTDTENINLVLDQIDLLEYFK